jgi:predicted small lipoprotein YifL
MYKTLWLILTLLVSSCLLSACGQKGDLYLPDEAKEEQKKD